MSWINKWFCGFKNEKNRNRSRFPELGKKVDEILKDSTLQEAEQIVSDYARVCEYTSHILKPEKLLPHSKEKIRKAIKSLLFIRGLMLYKSSLLGLSSKQQEELKKYIEWLKAGYVILDNFVSDEAADRAKEGQDALLIRNDISKLGLLAEELKKQMWALKGLSEVSEFYEELERDIFPKLYPNV